MSAFKELSPRWNHYAVSFASDGKLYMVGGRDESGGCGTSMSLSTVEIFDPYLEVWEQPRSTTGEPPPPGLSGVGYTSTFDSTWDEQRLYMYGGFNGQSWSSKLHYLDMVKFRWNEVKIWSLSEFERYRSKPMPKAGCGLTAFYRSQLACFGGYGVLQGDKQKGSKFTPDARYDNGRGWTNEFHLLQYESGKLYSESHDMTGSPPPPCAYCSFTSVGLFRAVLFGGYQPDEQHVTDAVYFVDMQAKHWSPLEKSADKPQWPVGRSLHAACCINYREYHEPNPQDRPQLLISGGSNSYDGTNSYGSTRSDVWMLDIASKVWKKLKVNPQYSAQIDFERYMHQLGQNPGFKEPSPQSRCLHTMTTINTEQAPQFLNVIMFGGCCTEYTANISLSNEHQKSVADTTMLRFMLDWSSRSAHEVATPTRDLWVLTHVETASETKFGSSTRISDRILSLTQRATRALNNSDECRERERDTYRMLQSAHEKIKETEEKLRTTEQAYQELKATQTITQLTSTSTEVEELDEGITWFQSAEKEAREAGGKVKEAERKAREAEEKVKEAEGKARGAEEKIRAAENRAIVAEQALQSLQTHTQITNTEAVQQTPQTSHVSIPNQMLSGSKRKAEDNEANTIGTKKLRENAPEKQLDEADHFEITTYLMNLPKDTVLVLGLALGLTHTRMTEMKDSATFLDDMVAAWLRKEDSVESRGIPSWRNLVKALKHERVKQTGIANKIEDECLGQ